MCEFILVDLFRELYFAHRKKPTNHIFAHYYYYYYYYYYYCYYYYYYYN